MPLMEAKLVHFLLVEDDDSHAEITIRSLKRNRVSNTVDRVSDGVQALEYLRQQGAFQGRPRPDVVLLDLKLPKRDGHEVLAEIKDDLELQAIPVVILTTSDAESDRAKAYHHHANSYLVKPLDFDRFRQMVNDLSLYWGVWNRPTSEDMG
jgi:CheY-like chemotaxis protein